MADYKSSEGKKEIMMKVVADVSDALKGLKAVQREAKKATAALKELEEQQKEIESINIYADDRVVGKYCMGCRRHQKYCICSGDTNE